MIGFLAAICLQPGSSPTSVAGKCVLLAAILSLHVRPLSRSLALFVKPIHCKPRGRAHRHKLAVEFYLLMFAIPLPDLDEICLRLRAARPKWDWREEPDPYDIVVDPPLDEVNE